MEFALQTFWHETTKQSKISPEDLYTPPLNFKHVCGAVMNSHISDPHRIFSVDSPQKHPGSYSPLAAQNPGPPCDPFCGGGPPLAPLLSCLP